MQYQLSPSRQCTKMLGKGSSCFFIGNYQVVWILFSGARSLCFDCGYSWSYDCIYSKAIQSQPLCQICMAVKVSRRIQKLRCSSQIKILVLHSLVRFWDMFLEVLLAMNLGWRWVVKDFRNQRLSVFILLWYTQTWFTAKLLATQVFPCCVAFPSFPRKKLGTVSLLDNTRPTC